nr:MAG TPA: hypothetical protein [Caudoviricetes sp.]
MPIKILFFYSLHITSLVFYHMNIVHSIVKIIHIKMYLNVDKVHVLVYYISVERR